MSRYRGPRLRVIRRLGRLPSITQKIPKRNTRPGQHGTSRKKLTQFSYRLIEKQKLRFYYGISEKQLVRYIKEVQKAKGPTGQILLQKLEQRLDNIVYRLGWAPTLPSARQLVAHGHILVNKKRVNIPRYACILNDIIRVRDKDKIRNLIETTDLRKLPAHLSIRTENLTATINQRVDRSDILLPLNELLVIEYYSNRLSTRFQNNHYFSKNYVYIYIYIMSRTFLPSLLVPLIGLVLPRAIIRFVFLYIEEEFIR
jgi:small subunit ribosomal protein S4